MPIPNEYGAWLLGFVSEDGSLEDGTDPIGWSSYWVEFENGSPMLHVKYENDTNGETYSGKWLLIRQVG